MLLAARFSVGTLTHPAELIAAGVDLYDGVPAPVRWFWVSLSVVDPVIVVLLLTKL